MCVVKHAMLRVPVERRLFARGTGCPSSFTIGTYEAMATTKVHYALPLCIFHPIRWHVINADHRRVLHMCHRLPRGSRVTATLAETGTWPVSLTGKLRDHFHIEHLNRALNGDSILSQLHALPDSHVGSLFYTFDSTWWTSWWTVHTRFLRGHRLTEENLLRILNVPRSLHCLRSPVEQTR
ncbi:hypothetical protein HPB51_017245 [Rhipicephalus microplus]|uniref:Uncharacterized protein n=1 Tax=Rhipicephalus microplus TaxID=6941 RepID=A0A9J6ETJ7_RHIMP|nr:hypothetical protein HPB51_017245 [Rhipicephalus microplus]